MSTFAGEGATQGADGRPLTDQEYQLLQRLLSDPFSLPIQFKTWLVSYLETSDMNLPISAINGLTQILGLAGVGGGVLGVLPAGIILPYGADASPAGALLCDGASYLQTAYARLYAAIGSRYGAAPAGSFLVPDLRDRVPTGKGVHSDHDTLGKSDGSALGTRRTKHKHTMLGWHNTGVTGGVDSNDVLVGDALQFVTEEGAHDHAPADGLAAPTDGPAFITINFIIVA